MNEKISANEFRESLDRHLSDMKADPWLAQRIIDSVKGEEQMKKKPAISLALVLVMLFGITAVAFAANEVYKMITIDQNGEIVEKQDVEIQPGHAAEQEPVPAEDEALKAGEFLSAAPEDQYAQVYIDDQGWMKVPQQTIGIESEFNLLIDGCDHLTRPTAVPEGYYFDRAVVFLGCDGTGDYLSEEFREGEDGYFARYSIADGFEVIIGYDVTYRNEQGQFINICDELSEYNGDEGHLFSFPEGYSYHSLNLPGMEYSFGLAGSGRNHVNMMRSLDGPIVCRWYPEKAKKDAPAGMMPDFFTYQSEEISVTSDSADIEVLSLMYDK